MIVVLSRRYDVEVIFKNKAIKDVEFIGVLRKIQEFQERLKRIQNFEIYNGKVILE